MNPFAYYHQKRPAHAQKVSATQASTSGHPQHHHFRRILRVRKRTVAWAQRTNQSEREREREREIPLMMGQWLRLWRELYGRSRRLNHARRREQRKYRRLPALGMTCTEVLASPGTASRLAAGSERSQAKRLPCLGLRPGWFRFSAASANQPPAKFGPNLRRTCARTRPACPRGGRSKDEIYRAAVGVRKSRQSHVGRPPATCFHIGSRTKSMTATLTALLRKASWLEHNHQEVSRS